MTDYPEKLVTIKWIRVGWKDEDGNIPRYLYPKPYVFRTTSEYEVGRVLNVNVGPKLYHRAVVVAMDDMTEEGENHKFLKAKRSKKFPFWDFDNNMLLTFDPNLMVAEGIISALTMPYDWNLRVDRINDNKKTHWKHFEYKITSAKTGDEIKTIQTPRKPCKEEAIKWFAQYLLTHKQNS